MAVELDLGKSILDSIYPPPPPAYMTSPVAFGEIVHNRTNGPAVWHRAPHIEVMEEAIVRTIAKPEGRLMIAVTVRAGKSMFGSRIVPAHFLGTHPDKRVLLAGHEADFASRHGRAARDILTEFGPGLFKVSVSSRSEAANRWDLHQREGGMLTLGVGGSPIGRGGDLVIVDDPYKNYADAMNPRVRKKVLEWWTGTMVTRIEPGGSVIIIMARWHRDDLIGVLSRAQPGEWEVLTMPALCTDPDTDPMGRAMGESIWPERYPEHILEKRHAEVSITEGEVVWEAQYQQNPLAANNAYFNEETWGWFREIPKMKRWCRAWDLAASKNKGDWTVGLLMGDGGNGKWYIVDVVRERYDSAEVRALMMKTAARDRARFGDVMIEIPQDPAQAGLDQADQLVTMLSGYSVRKKLQTGAKEVRASGLSSQQLIGNVLLPEDAKAVYPDGKRGETLSWVGKLVGEYSEFDTGDHDDQVDAGASAFNRLVGRGSRLLV